MTEKMIPDANWRAPEYGRQQIILDSILPLEELMARGRQHALSSGTNKRRVEDEEYLREYARSIARDTYLDNFDPAKHSQDKLRQEAFDKDEAEYDTAKIAEKYAMAEVGKSEQELAKIKTDLQEPILSVWVVFFGISTLALSFAPTFHDRFFFGIADDVLAWFFSACAAMIVGGFIAWTQLGYVDDSGERMPANWLGLIAGIGIGIGAGVLRASDAHGARELTFAVGLTLFEISSVVCVEVVAARRRRRVQVWGAYRQRYDTLEALLKADEANLERRNSDVKAIERRRADYINYVESRWIRSNKVDDLEVAATNAIVQGYNHGVAENEGRLLGLKQRA